MMPQREAQCLRSHFGNHAARQDIRQLRRAEAGQHFVRGPVWRRGVAF